MCNCHAKNASIRSEHALIRRLLKHATVALQNENFDLMIDHYRDMAHSIEMLIDMASSRRDAANAENDWWNEHVNFMQTVITSQMQALSQPTQKGK